MAGTKVFTAGEVLSAADLNGNFSKLPYAYAAGTASSQTTALAAGASIGSITITYPASRFSVAPIVQCWTGSTRYIVSPTANAAGSATVAVRNVSDGTGAIETIYYMAVQMTAGTAAG
jgi:hypothetical protein